MTKVTRYLGAPGCGKTTTLQNKLEEERDENGLTHDSVYWLCFTNSGADDTASAFRDVFAQDVDELDALDNRVRTFHSLALSLARDEGLINDPREQVIDPSQEPAPFREFCNDHGLVFDQYAGDPLRSDNSASDAPAGNKLFRADEYLRVRRLSTKKVRLADREIGLPMPNRRAHELLQSWREFKRDHSPRLFTHSDYVAAAVEAGATPDVDVLMFDEFQDLNALEIESYKLWRDSAARVYIAGDPAQSIYDFRGAEPQTLENLEVDETRELRASYRCPENIADVAADVLTSHRETTDYSFTGRENGGVVRRLDDSAGVDGLAADVSERLNELTAGYEPPEGRYEEPEPELMLLARTNWRAKAIGNALRDEGIPHHWLSSWRGWTEDMGRIKLALEKILDGQKPMKQLARPLFKNLAGDSGIQWSRYGIDVSVGDLCRALPADLDALRDELDMSDWKAGAIVRALQAEEDVPPGAVAVGTIHSAKGLEAPHVYVDTYAPQTIRQAYDRHGGGEEHRLYYVGLSRASETLSILEADDGRINPAVRGVVL